MPATPLTPTQLSYLTSTADPTDQTPDVANGNSVPNAGTTLLRLKNTDTASHTVTIALASTVDGQTVTPRTHTVAAGATRFVPVGPVSLYGSTAIITADSTTLKITAFLLS